jgi:hypothetical protein
MNPVHFVTGNIQRMYQRPTPEQPTDPPLPTEEEFERGLRISCAQDALGTLRDRMGELDLYFDLAPV